MGSKGSARGLGCVLCARRARRDAAAAIVAYPRNSRRGPPLCAALAAGLMIVWRKLVSGVRAEPWLLCSASGIGLQVLVGLAEQAYVRMSVRPGHAREQARGR